MSIATLITGIGSLLLYGYGLYKQEQQNVGIRAESRQQLARDTAKEEARYATQLAMTREGIAEQRAERQKEWAWKEEDRNYQRAQEFSNNFQALLDRSPGLRNNLVNIWNQRRV